jgi:hypothetical protein
MGRLWWVLLAAFTASGAAVLPVRAQALLTQDEALALAYPAADSFERRTAFLTDEDAAAVAQHGGTEIDQRVVTYYVALRGSSPVGVAYFDAHRVRTLREVLMVALGEEGRVRRLEVLSFAEPREYLSPEGWLALFRNGDDAEADVRRDVPNITGATLTSNAVKDAVTRVLALHHVIAPGLGGAS